MSRRDFELLARNIRFIQDTTARRLAAIAVACACAQFNPRFDSNQFFVACDVSAD